MKLLNFRCVHCDKAATVHPIDGRDALPFAGCDEGVLPSHEWVEDNA